MKICAGAIAAAILALASWSSFGQQTSPWSPRKFLKEPIADTEVNELLAHVERAPFQAGAWLDFAIALCEKGHSAEAQEVLLHIESAFAPPEGIREVIRLLRQSQCRNPTRKYRISLNAYGGHDSNVNQGASSALFELGSSFPGVVLPLAPEFLPRSDNYTGVDATAEWGNPRDSMQWTLQWRDRRYDKLRGYQTQVLALGADREWACAGWRCVTGGTVGLIELGGKPYQYVASMQVGSTSNAQAWVRGTMAIEASLTRHAFPSQSHLDAWIAQAKATWRVPIQSSGHVQGSVSLGLDFPTTDNRPGGQRTQAAWMASGAHPLGQGYQAEWSLQHQTTRDAASYSPGLINTTRRPTLQVTSLSLAKILSSNQKLRLEYRHAVNRDTISLFSYRSNALSLAWQWQGNY